MAAIRLEFAQFGHFDYFKIYRNLASTNIEDLGQPIGTSSTMYYEDSTVEPSLSYFYRVGVVRDLAEEFSAEINVIADVVFTPPYNLTVEFKNDGVDCLELNWSLDGIVDEQRYYCSETPIDSENLPVPKAVLAGNIRAYTDFAITEGSEYYICVGSVRNGVEKLSDEINVVADNRIYRVQLKVTSSNLLNSYGTLPLTWSQSNVTLIHANNEIQQTSSSSFLKLNETFNWSGAWDIEFDAYIDSSVSNAYKSIVANRVVWESYGGIFIFYGDTGANAAEDGRFGIGNYGVPGLMSNVMSKDNWHHVRCIKTADHKYTMYVNDVLQYSNATTPVSNTTPSDGVINIGGGEGAIVGSGVKIRNFIIH